MFFFFLFCWVINLNLVWCGNIGKKIINGKVSKESKEEVGNKVEREGDFLWEKGSILDWSCMSIN